MRSQIQVFQFLLFFLIGLYIFSSIILFLSSYGSYSQARFALSYEKLVSNYVSSAFVDIVVYCRHCNFTLLNLSIPRRIIDDTYTINLTSFYVYTPLYNKIVEIGNYNLNSTYTFSGSIFIESKIVQIAQDFVLPVSVISFTFDKNEKRVAIF